MTQHNIASIMKNCPTNSEMRPLADNYKPVSCDVICKRGRNAYNHNKHFRELIEKHLEKYSRATSKLEKSLVVSDIVDTIRAGSPEGGFVREIDGVYYEVGDAIAREKVGGAFRDMLSHKYKSSTKAKKRRRQEGDKMEEATPVEKPVAAKTPGPVVEVPKKRRKVDFAATVSPTPSVAPLSPTSTKVMCAFGGLLKDIACRRQELVSSPTPSTVSSSLPPLSVVSIPLNLKAPTLPPPPSFPSAPRSAAAAMARGCSIESMVSFDLNEMEEIDEFDLGLARFTSVATTGSAFSFSAAV